jgi:type I restriction-modification system DNA methylase subunit
MPKLDKEQLRTVKTFPDLLDYLRRELEWPIQYYEPDDLTFDWSADTLHVSEHHGSALSDGVVRQLRSMTANQPWGIFLVEFNDDRIHRGALREILRGLAANRRRDPSLPAWQHDNLLFICATQGYDRITFAHFRGEQMQKARLTMFGWQRESPYLRTLCEFNLPALRWPDDPSDCAAWLKGWAAAFDKEPLTKEFFKRFDKALEAIKADLEEYQNLLSAEAYSRAQLLLERLLFLYFLQNRGWLNRQHDYLLKNFQPHRDRPMDCSYYADFLERLFWTLASAPGSDAYRLEGIPFLNGGLFDDDEFAPTAVRRKNNPPLRIRNATFALVFQNLLEAFNFTVREDTPLDQDVAVDPEMLGKVFESIVLHAEAQAEYNAPDKRKATGSYYTPRIVVHFICREALRLYLRGQLPDAEWDAKIRALLAVDPTNGLDAEEMAALKTAFKPTDGRRLMDILQPVKMCDPAVGSGAFPVGLLHELVNLRRVAETVANGFVDPARRQGSNWIHETKADIVENCLYGVDIQQQAIEICRLRLWLSLIVDYDLGLDAFEADPAQFRQAIQSISQLPNLEMNFRRGDSLLDYICGMNARVAPEKSDAYRKEYLKIRDLGLKLHHAKRSDRKRELRLEILRQRLDLSERVLTDEIKALRNTNSQLTLSVISETESEAAKRRQVEQEVGRLRDALQEVAADRKTLERIASRPFDIASFYPEIRKLEGADFNSPFNFSWRIDFADIFQTDRGGFDLILGNPPFVTARNPEKRELYRERWKRVCSGKYLLVCPFFDLSFGLLRPGGQLGFIVSNAFAKREFGQPLIEDFFPTVDLQKIVDCSGLTFPGHGTPTCIVFGQNQKPAENTAIRITATLPGGGDLRTPPEESPLWRSIAAHHDDSTYVDERITVADRARREMAKWPWNLEMGEQPTRQALESTSSSRLLDILLCEVGFDLITGSDDFFVMDEDYARRNGLPTKVLLPYQTGEFLRNWSFVSQRLALFPYINGEVVDLRRLGMESLFSEFKTHLRERLCFGKTAEQRGMKWWEYAMVMWSKRRSPSRLAFSQIATHAHFIVSDSGILFKEKSPVVKLPDDCSLEQYHATAGLLNSSAALFWLKQICFNKGAGEDEQRDRFEYAGGKVQQLPVPNAVVDALRGKRSELAERLTALSQACWERGRQIPALAMKKLFEKPGEAYYDWNSALSGYVAPDPRLGQPFQTSEHLKDAFSRACQIREGLRAEMIALQEEMDWLVYEAYGLIGGPRSVVAANVDTDMTTDATGHVDATERVPPMMREQRPFVLWAKGDGDFDRAVGLIPDDWPDDRQSLWRARLEAIRDSEHIRRIEQPVYKRRWDEQWKVGNRWQCGPVAYDAEFVDAFDWWLSEKAEWWLEKKKNGGPVALDEWTAALQQDPRVQAAWGVVSEALGRLGKRADFTRYFSALVKEQSVPDDIPAAVPWDELEKKRKIPATVKRIRGKLNVPRERFRVTGSGGYLWAGVNQ